MCIIFSKSPSAATCPRSRSPSTAAATAAILLQVAIVYWTTGLLKDGAAWRDGTAVYYALHLDFWVTAVGEWLREQKTILP